MTNDGPLDALALAAVAAVTGAWPKQPDMNRKTYIARNGKRFHLRTYDPESARFFGINERCWKPHEYFVLACGGEMALFVVPVGALPEPSEFPLRGNDRLVHVECEGGVWYVRDPYPRFLLANYRDAFDLLT